MKKITALFLSLLLVMAFVCGCGNDGGGIKSSKDLVGTWTMEMDISALSQSMDDTGMESFEEFESVGFKLDPIRITTTFAADGTMTIKMSDMVDWMVSFCDDFVQWLDDDNNFYAYFEKASGMSREDVDAQFAQQGMTKADVIEMLDTTFNQMVEAVRGELEEESTVSSYAYEGGKLYTWEEDETREDADWMVIKPEGKVLIVTEVGED